MLELAKRVDTFAALIGRRFVVLGVKLALLHQGLLKFVPLVFQYFSGILLLLLLSVPRGTEVLLRFDATLIRGYLEQVVDAASRFLVDADHGNVQPLISLVVLFFRDLRWRSLFLFRRHLYLFIKFWFFASHILFERFFEELVALEHPIVGTRFDLEFQVLEQMVDDFLVVRILQGRF